jgi:hypothetical protein
MRKNSIVKSPSPSFTGKHRAASVGSDFQTVRHADPGRVARGYQAPPVAHHQAEENPQATATGGVQFDAARGAGSAG